MSATPYNSSSSPSTAPTKLRYFALRSPPIRKAIPSAPIPSMIAGAISSDTSKSRSVEPAYDQVTMGIALRTVTVPALTKPITMNVTALVL